MLIAFEGIDGAGKSTAIQSLSASLLERDLPNVVIDSPCLGTAEAWDDDEDEDGCEGILAEILELRDELKGNLGPRALCLANAWDFAHRWEALAEPAVRLKKIVLWDRYFYTPLVREVLRGIDEDYVRAVYGFATEPDLVIHVDLDAEQAYARKLKAGMRIGYFESGLDIAPPGANTRQSFLNFQGQCRQRYELVLPADKTVKVDGAQPAETVHGEIESVVLERLGRAK